RRAPAGTQVRLQRRRLVRGAGGELADADGAPSERGHGAGETRVPQRGGPSEEAREIGVPLAVPGPVAVARGERTGKEERGRTGSGVSQQVSSGELCAHRSGSGEVGPHGCGALVAWLGVVANVPSGPEFWTRGWRRGNPAGG